jgi:hypothetical protein
MDPLGGTAVVEVADLNSWTLDQARDQVDVTAFGDANKQYVLGLKDIKGTYGGFWNSDSSPLLFQVAGGTTPVTLNLVPARDEPTFFFEGKGYLDASINVSSGGAVTLSGNFVAAGDWTLEGPAALLARRQVEGEPLAA